jgi:hypothetical protein
MRRQTILIPTGAESLDVIIKKIAWLATKIDDKRRKERERSFENIFSLTRK